MHGGMDALRTVGLADEGSRLEATWAPEAGMVCCSLKHRGEELLAQNTGLQVYAQRGKTMGIPLLYPWANRLGGWSYEAAGKHVAIPRDPELIATDGNGLPIHGVIGGRQAWEILAASSSLTASLSWSREHTEPFAAFPFEHEVTYEATLADGTLRATVTVAANAADEVPVSFGFHPYLSPPGAEREHYWIELPRMRRLRLDERQLPTGPDEWIGPWRDRLNGHVWDDGYDSLPPSAEFAVRAGERRLQLSFEAGYDYAQVYSPRGGRFVCFEPMIAPTNALISGEGLRVLAPGERYTASWELRVLDVAAGVTGQPGEALMRGTADTADTAASAPGATPDAAQQADTAQQG
jgi:aldose 1-epimerase